MELILELILGVEKVLQCVRDGDGIAVEMCCGKEEEMEAATF